MRKLTLRQWMGGIVVAIATIGYVVYQYRGRQIDRLYAEAAGIPPFAQGTAQAQTAVKKPAAYSGQRVTAMLLNIALGRTPFTWPETEREAINALADRKEPPLSEAVAILLQPQQTLPPVKQPRRPAEALYETLYGVLRRQTQPTIITLAQVYGLGTDAPSKFALSLVARMHFHDACPALLQSEQLLKQSSAERFTAPREDLEATLDG